MLCFYIIEVYCLEGVLPPKKEGALILGATGLHLNDQAKYLFSIKRIGKYSGLQLFSLCRLLELLFSLLVGSAHGCSAGSFKARLT